MGVVLRQAYSESQCTVLVGYLAIWTNVRRYQTHHRLELFLSGRQRTGALCVCVTQSNWVKMWFLCFPILPGSAEAQVIWGGILRRLLIAYFISNISAKKIWKSIRVCQSYSKPKVGVDVFWDMVYRVAQLKWGQLTFSMVTFECMGKIQRFLAHVNYM